MTRSRPSDADLALAALPDEEFNAVAAEHLKLVDHVIDRTTSSLDDEQREAVHAAVAEGLVEKNLPASHGAIDIAINQCLKDNLHLGNARKLCAELIELWPKVRPSGDFAIANVDEFFANAVHAFRLYDTMLKEFSQSGLDVELPPELSEEMEYWRGVFSATRAAAAELKHGLERGERIAAKQAERKPDVVMEGTKCSNCKKKPARVDDLCKICAREAGVLPHGKIV